MIEAKIYRGIEYVRLKELPDDQRIAIRNWLNQDVIIKIQTDAALLTDCILFKDYKEWFEKIYTSAVSGDIEKVKADVQRIKPLRGLAFD